VGDDTGPTASYCLLPTAGTGWIVVWSVGTRIETGRMHLRADWLIDLEFPHSCGMETATSGLST